MTPTPEQERGPSRTYSDGAIEVLWEPRLCIHVRNWVRRLPQVFNPEVRPWVVVDAADADRVAATIETCPTGALHYRRFDGGREEKPQEEMTVEPRPKRPALRPRRRSHRRPERPPDSGRHAGRAVPLWRVREQALLRRQPSAHRFHDRVG